MRSGWLHPARRPCGPLRARRGTQPGWECCELQTDWQAAALSRCLPWPGGRECATPRRPAQIPAPSSGMARTTAPRNPPPRAGRCARYGCENCCSPVPPGGRRRAPPCRHRSSDSPSGVPPARGSRCDNEDRQCAGLACESPFVRERLRWGPRSRISSANIRP